MKNAVIFFVFFLETVFTIAQSRNSIWCFGDSAGIDFNNVINPVPFTSVMRGRGSCVSICNPAGSLLFYAFTRAGSAGNTTQVVAKNDSLMMNGSNIVGEGWYYELIIIPDPSDTNQYYLFSNGVTGSSQIGLYYSKIDMTLNSGLGEVVQKNIQLLPYYFSDGIQVVKHGNGRDWWLISRQCGITTNEHFLYLISPFGISSPLSQLIGTSTYTNTTTIGISSDGKKIVETNGSGLIEIFDFDRCSGVLSNSRIIHQEANPYVPFWSSEFSPNSNILYVGTDAPTSYLLQLNLTDPDPWLTHDTLWYQPFIQYSGGQLKLAPDGKIYYASAWYDGINFNYPYPDSAFYPENMNLGVINNPDILGGGCDFQPYSFYLGGHRTYIGLPNNPNYELSADSNSLCDSLSVGIGVAVIGKHEMNIFYHSGWQTAFINAEGLQGNNYTLSIFDLAGREIYNAEGTLFSSYFTKDVSCSTFPSGMYIVNFKTENEVLSKKFIKQ